MHRFPLILSLVLGACGGDTPIWPDSTTGAGGMSASSSATSASSGQGSGAGGGLSCDPCEQTDGSRLVRRFTTTTSPDGLMMRQLVGLHDTQRKEACSPLLATDGVLRCLPTGGVAVALLYADATCTIPLAYLTPSQCVGTPPKYLASQVPDPSGDICKPGTTELRAVGAPFNGATFIKSGNNCATFAAPGYTFYSVGSAIAPSEFAPVEYVTSP